MSTPTTNLALNKPAVGGDLNTWGALANTNWDTLDTLLGSVGKVGYYATNAASISTVKVSFQGKSGGNDSYITVDGDNWSSILSFNALNSASKQIRASYVKGELIDQTAGAEKGRLNFWTKPSTGGASARMTIEDDGQVYIGSTLSGNTPVSGFAHLNVGGVNGFSLRGFKGNTLIGEINSDGLGFLNFISNLTNSGLKLRTTNSSGSNVDAVSLNPNGDATFSGIVNATTAFQVNAKTIYGASAYIDFTVTATVPTNRRSANIASVTRVSQGIYDFVFTTAASDAYYSVVGTGSTGSSGSTNTVTLGITDKTTSGFRVTFVQVNVALYDPVEASIIVMGG